MAKNKKKNAKYSEWCIDKFGRTAFWDKSNYHAHIPKHYNMVYREAEFVKALTDPDVVYPDRYDKNTQVFYRLGSFSEDNRVSHARVVVLANQKRHPNPPKQPFTIIKSAHESDVLYEKGIKSPIYKRGKNENESNN